MNDFKIFAFYLVVTDYMVPVLLLKQVCASLPSYPQL